MFRFFEAAIWNIRANARMPMIIHLIFSIVKGSVVLRLFSVDVIVLIAVVSSEESKAEIRLIVSASAYPVSFRLLFV